MKPKNACTTFVFGMVISVASKPTDCNYKLPDCTTATDLDLHFYTNCYVPSSGITDLCENLCGWDLNALSYECTRYCPEFIEVCVKPRHDNMTSQPSSVTTPVASNSQTTSEVGASELSTAPGGTKMAVTQLITEVGSRQTSASSTQPPTPAKMKNGKNHDCIEYSRAQANIQGIVPLVLLLFVSIALNFAGFDTTTFKYRMSRCHRSFWSPRKDHDHDDSEENSDIEENQDSENNRKGSGNYLLCSNNRIQEPQQFDTSKRQRYCDKVQLVSN
ncbi:uncharacterized protein [Watersipora subatra]|uniref:uncharacterized protein n=1 Tax=Watersipora subatra TaxID=2589382 RepID=UPI00355C147E